MKAISLRGIDDQLAQALQERAAKASASVNATILGVLREGLGLGSPTRRRAHHDLDHLAGTWNAEEEAAFNDAVAPLQQIDEDLWR